jgi:hypothetical protein
MPANATVATLAVMSLSSAPEQPWYKTTPEDAIFTGVKP